MVDRPIIMTSESVRGILDGRKTQTRRIAKLPEEWHKGWGAFKNNPHGDEEYIIHGECGTKTTYCPYGRVGDRLWMKESLWVSECGKYYARKVGPGGQDYDVFTIDGKKYWPHLREDEDPLPPRCVVGWGNRSTSGPRGGNYKFAFDLSFADNPPNAL